MIRVCNFVPIVWQVENVDIFVFTHFAQELHVFLYFLHLHVDWIYIIFMLLVFLKVHIAAHF